MIPLLVLPRYWPSQIIQEVDAVRLIGKEAADLRRSEQSHRA